MTGIDGILQNQACSGKPGSQFCIGLDLMARCVCYSPPQETSPCAGTSRCNVNQSGLNQLVLPPPRSIHEHHQGRRVRRSARGRDSHLTDYGTQLVADAATAHLAADSFLVLGILANYHKYETRNAMLVRFEDLVDETIMKRVREAAALSLQQARE